MKLTNELKSKIDRYFDKISAEELYDVLTNKYDFPDVGDICNHGEYISSLTWDSDTIIQDYMEILVDGNGGVISEDASKIYRLAA